MSVWVDWLLGGVGCTWCLKVLVMLVLSVWALVMAVLSQAMAVVAEANAVAAKKSVAAVAVDTKLVGEATAVGAV